MIVVLAVIAGCCIGIVIGFRLGHYDLMEEIITPIQQLKTLKIQQPHREQEFISHAPQPTQTLPRRSQGT